jgi:FecR-like protein
VRLAAGTHVRLDGTEEIELTVGAAFVDATPGARAPLRIVTPHGIVTHLGTQYLVRSERDRIEVSVREGRAQLKTGQATTIAEAGEWLLHRDRDGAVQSGKVTPDDARFEWISALPTDFKLDGATLGQFLGWFQRETGLAPIYADGLNGGQLGQVQLKGSIDELEPLEALSLVLSTADLAWHRDGQKVIIDQRSAKAG